MDLLRQQIVALYPNHPSFHKEVEDVIKKYALRPTTEDISLWDQRSVWLITYGDVLTAGAGTRPLRTLRHFYQKRTLCFSKSCDKSLYHPPPDLSPFTTVHILPFFPYTSDDGFSVVDYRQIRADLGSWDDIDELAKNVHLMFDLVLNHCSKSSDDFKEYLALPDSLESEDPSTLKFIEVDPEIDLSMVVRPRTHPLLTPVQTKYRGIKHVWTTFSDDQMDLNFSNPKVLLDFLDLLLFYATHGATAIRLDAIAYLWKTIGTPCIHLEQVHQVVRIMRSVVDLAAPGVILLTETNVKHVENISYLGLGPQASTADGPEAHMVYQFPLPPLLLHSFLSESSFALAAWVHSLVDTPLKEHCTFLNFTASHDGVGVRPLEGLVPAEDVQALVDHVKQNGGRVSSKTNADGSESVYELNATYFDILCQHIEQPDSTDVARFLSSQAIALAMQGVPAVYFPSLFGARNDVDGACASGHARTINREKFTVEDIETRISSPGVAATIWDGYMLMLMVRGQCKAFHPTAEQRVLVLRQDSIPGNHAPESVFALIRWDSDDLPHGASAAEHSIVVNLTNLSSGTVSLSLAWLSDWDREDAGSVALRHTGSRVYKDLLDNTFTPVSTEELLAVPPCATRWLTPI